MGEPTSAGFESILSWLYTEREVYQTEKFNYKEERNERLNAEYWIQQFDSYIQRLPIFGLDTPQGIQAACKLAATAIALCEHLAEEYGLPKPGVSGGVIEEWS